MARYRIVGERPAYMATGPVSPLDFGDVATNRAFGIRAAVCELLQPGQVVDFDGIPGPHLEPIDEPAKEAMRSYLRSG